MERPTRAEHLSRRSCSRSASSRRWDCRSCSRSFRSSWNGRPGDAGQVALWVGALTSVYAGCALFAGPILGTLSDRVGSQADPGHLPCRERGRLGHLRDRRVHRSRSCSARIVDGVTAGEQSVVFAAMADITTPGERAKRFGLMGAVSGMAFLIGPALGGLLAGIDVAAPAFAAAGASALTAVLALVALPESLPVERRSAETTFDLNPFGALRKAATLPGLARRMVVFALIVSTLTVVSSNFAVLSFDVLAWDPVQIGWLLTGVGVVDIIVQGGLLGLLVRLAGERGVIIGGLLGLAVSFAHVRRRRGVRPESAPDGGGGTPVRDSGGRHHRDAPGDALGGGLRGRAGWSRRRPVGDHVGGRPRAAAPDRLPLCAGRAGCAVRAQRRPPSSWRWP